MKEKLKNQKAITLIALVVTIVVLLILAGITINMVFSNNGVIKQAQDAKNVQENAQAKDQEAVDELMSQMDEILGGESFTGFRKGILYVDGEPYTGYWNNKEGGVSNSYYYWEGGRIVNIFTGELSYYSEGKINKGLGMDGLLYWNSDLLNGAANEHSQNVLDISNFNFNADFTSCTVPSDVRFGKARWT